MAGTKGTSRVLDLTDGDALAAVLAEAGLVPNTAGPFYPTEARARGRGRRYDDIADDRNRLLRCSNSMTRLDESIWLNGAGTGRPSRANARCWVQQGERALEIRRIELAAAVVDDRHQVLHTRPAGTMARFVRSSDGTNDFLTYLRAYRGHRGVSKVEGR